MSPLANFTGLCVDAQGNVFVPTWQGESGTRGYVYEFAHGGSTPIATLSDPGGAFGCSVDLTTGNLAVTNNVAPGSEFRSGSLDLAAYLPFPVLRKPDLPMRTTLRGSTPYSAAALLSDPPSRMRVRTCVTFWNVACERRGSLSNAASVLGRRTR